MGDVNSDTIRLPHIPLGIDSVVGTEITVPGEHGENPSHASRHQIVSIGTDVYHS